MILQLGMAQKVRNNQPTRGFKKWFDKIKKVKDVFKKDKNS